ncbi:MAG: hypothetical protein A2Y73_08595 [Chloroflexi bacterium RBG_13_56_8]|nr:MAG: hypothetical protein A2Y73_08595 [Chloroflexi bacterium RBG_13_56_8]
MQIFDPDGKYITQWNNLYRPCGMHITGGPNPVCFVGQLLAHLNASKNFPNIGRRVTVHDLTGRQLAVLGDAEPGVGPTHIPAAHGIAADSRGDLYISEVSWSAVGSRMEPQQRGLPCLRKLIKVSGI